MLFKKYYKLLSTLLVFETILQVICQPKNKGFRITGGQRVNKENWPFLVAIAHKNKYVCSGTLIRSSWVLSAAHCFITKRTDLGVVAEIEVIEKVEENGRHIPTIEAERQYFVEDIFFHHEFFMDEEKKVIILNHDICLLRLVNQMPVLDSNRVAVLPGFSPMSGKKCKIAGWGVQYEIPEDDYRDQIGRKLKEVDTTIIGSDTYKTHLEDVVKELSDRDKKMFFSNDKVFAIAINGSTSDGDGGGPLYCSGVQLGIASISRKVDDEVYVETCRVDTHIDWINKNLEAFGDELFQVVVSYAITDGPYAGAFRFYDNFIMLLFVFVILSIFNR